MSLPVYVEPTQDGFRAYYAVPPDLSADGASAEEAVAALKAKVTAKLAAGGRVFQVPFDDERFRQAWDGLANDPTFDQWVEAMAEYRREREAEDAAADDPAK